MTAALVDYRASSSNVAALLAMESGFVDPPSPSDQSAVQGLRGGSVVLMVAAFENYVKQSIAEVLDRINSANPPCEFAKLPIALQANVVYTGLEAAMKAKPWDPIQGQQLRLPGVLSAVQRINNGEILSADIARTAGNPNAVQIKAIFRVVGLPSIFSNIKPGFDLAWGTPTAHTFLEDSLNAIVQRRHVVAHTASILSTSRTDLANWQQFLNTFVTVIDGALERHIIRIIKKAQ